MIKIVSNLEPVSLNHIYKATCLNGRGKMYMDPKVKQYKREFELIARKQVKITRLTGKVRVIATCVFGTKRKKDIQNQLKVELDCLNGLVYEDDSQIHELIIRKGYKRNEPSLTLEIEEME